jgi:hypothetical protein
VTVDYVRAYLPADTLSGLHHNREVAFSYTVGNCLQNTTSAEQLMNIELYPNPADGFVQFRLPEGRTATRFVLSDVFGKIVSETSYPRMEVSSLSSGVYFVTAFFADTAVRHKLIIRH